MEFIIAGLILFIFAYIIISNILSSKGSEKPLYVVIVLLVIIGLIVLYKDVILSELVKLFIHG